MDSHVHHNRLQKHQPHQQLPPSPPDSPPTKKMRESTAGPLQVLKRKLSFHPLFPRGDKKIRSLRTAYSQDNLGMTHYQHQQQLQNGQEHRYPVLKLNDNLSLSIGDSFDSGPARSAKSSRSGSRGSTDSDASTAKRFEYGPIHHPKLIRLLLVLPAHDQDEPLETLLFHADLTEVPFQALSYAGGLNDPQPTSPDSPVSAKNNTRALRCNGRGLPVAASLYAALLAVRNLGDARAITIVWADGVCVNQTDLREREAHLRFMRDIFAASVVTTVYLGGPGGGTSGGGGCTKVFDTIDMLHEACRCPDFRDRLERDELDLGSLEHLSIGDKTLRIHADNRAELGRFFAHPWFDRIWTWQMVLSRKVFLLYGGRVRPWSHLVDTAWCMHKLRWESALVPELFAYGERRGLKYRHVLALEEHRKGIAEGKAGFGVLELLTASRTFAAAQCLDRVFGLYPLMGHPREREIAEQFFDYSLSPLTLYLNLTINLMLSQETLDVLHLVHNDPVARPGWPSFVPDLSAQNCGRQLGSRHGRSTWEYRAAGDTRPQMRIINGRNCSAAKIPRFEDDVHVALSGVIIDEVCRAGTEMKDSGGLNVAMFLSDWVNTALMTDGRKFYTMDELAKARNIWLSTHAPPKTANGSGGRDSSLGPAGARRPSLPALPASQVSRRPSMPSLGNRRPSVPHIINTRRPSLGPDAAAAAAASVTAIAAAATRTPTSKAPPKTPKTPKTPSAAGGAGGQQPHLRNSFAPSLLSAIQKIDIEAEPDSPTLPQPKTPKTPGMGPFGNSSVSTLPSTPYPIGNISAVEAFWRTLIRNQAGPPAPAEAATGGDAGKVRGRATTVKNGQVTPASSRASSSSLSSSSSSSSSADASPPPPPPSKLQKSHFEPWFAAASGPVGSMLEALQPTGHSHRSADGSGSARRPIPEFNSWVHRATAGSRIIRTKTGYIGTAPRWVEEGDLICILYGGQTPFVLRREAWGNYRFVGDCYIHGIMDGEALGMDLDETEFVLV